MNSLNDEAVLARAKLPDDWKMLLKPALLSPYMQQLRAFLQAEYAAGKTIYPPKSQIFNAFYHTSYADTKVIILGQDPYHGAHQAMGLSFSVPKIIPKPRSLHNILKELAHDLYIPISAHGDLRFWAQQGVLLLNSILTVEEGRPGSHRHQGWELFSDYVMQSLNDTKQNLVFILWGNEAKAKGQYIDTSRHLVLSASHPSPLSANRGGFFGSRPFSKANHYLQAHHGISIDWQLPP